CVAHRLGGQRSFFRDGNVTGARGDDCDGTNAVVCLVAPDPNHTGRLVPFGISYDVPYFTVRTFVGACDYDIGRALRKALNDADDPAARFTATKNYLGEAHAKRAGMVNAREANVFEVEVLDAFDGLLALHFATFVGLQQLRQFLEIHVCCTEAAF